MIEKLLTRKGIVSMVIATAVLGIGLAAVAVWVVAHFIRKVW
jgi:hypothetical protein